MMVENRPGPFDVETLADKAIERLAVLPGQVIWIWASTDSLDLVEALAYRLRTRGAFWALRLTSESLSRRIGQDAPAEYLAQIPEHELRWLADIHAIADIHDHGGSALNIPLPRRRAMAAEWIALLDEAARRGIRHLSVMNPTPALASACNISLGLLRERCWQAIHVDGAALDRQQEQVAALLARARDVHVTSPLGTDLRLRTEGRPVHWDRDSLPGGEVYVAPHEEAANGVAVIDRAFIRGRPVERLRLTFADGRVAKIEAPDPGGADSLRELLAASSGDKDIIAEFAIGMNPGLAEPVGDAMLDEKIGGSVHIAIGMNANFGGRNRANLHLDLVMVRPTVWFDGVRVIDSGTLNTDGDGRGKPPAHQYCGGET